jgi:hypothetical protein
MAKQRQNQTEPLNDGDGANPGRAQTRTRRRAVIAVSAALAVGALAVAAEAIAGDSAAAPTHRSTKGYLIPEAGGSLIPPGALIPPDLTTIPARGVLIPEAYGALTSSLLPGAPEMSPEFLRALGLDG